jgi:hypothetical protein
MALNPGNLGAGPSGQNPLAAGGAGMPMAAGNMAGITGPQQQAALGQTGPDAAALFQSAKHKSRFHKKAVRGKGHKRNKRAKGSIARKKKR